jgi:hypothetical protein
MLTISRRPRLRPEPLSKSWGPEHSPIAPARNPGLDALFQYPLMSAIMLTDRRFHRRAMRQFQGQLAGDDFPIRLPRSRG